ncbi:MAG: folate-binding protein [Pseudomonadota bacterium]
MTGEAVAERRVLRISGPDARDFLQGLVTNDIARIDGGLVYAALLTPQGKYLADFFLLQDPQDAEAVLLDVAEDFADGLVRRLTMYKLRAAVTIEATDLHVQRGLKDAPEGALPDPRDAALGWRLYAAEPGAPSATDWDTLRIGLGVPETGADLRPDETFILEAGFERLDGVDFKKGCYVGQEVTARMKHKTELRKGLAVVEVEGQADPGTEIVTNGKVAGHLFSQAGGRGLAHLRFDRAGRDMRAGDATVHWTPES